MKPFVITSILAPTDLSDSSIPALRYARLFADRFAAKLTVLYTDPIVYPLDYTGPANAVYVTPTPEQQATLRVELDQHAAPVMAGRPYDSVVTVGQPIPAILSAARDHHAELIIMGTHLRHGWRRALLGSVSDGVIHGSDCAVLTVAGHERAGGARPFGITNVLCPVNFTDVARESVHVAERIAQAFGAFLTIVNVLEPDDVTNAATDEERVRRWVTPELQDATSFRELILRGGPAERVLDCADDLGADLIVVGAQHKLFRDATVIGTTTERLIRFASCPVLVVPRPVVSRRVKKEVPEESLAER
ncbi:MAG: universal stress protein [Thermoanaerobaculia bacterium]